MTQVFLIWSGATGGLESVTAQTAAAMRSQGIDARIVFVGSPDPLGARLDRLGVPHDSLGVVGLIGFLRARGRIVRAITRTGATRVLITTGGISAWILRKSGLDLPLIVIEHGAVLQLGNVGLAATLKLRLDDRLSASLADREVAVSDFIAGYMRRRIAGRRLAVIPNGVDLDYFAPTPLRDPGDRPLRLAFAARLIEGKGLDDLLHVLPDLNATVEIAGTGPMQARWQALATELGVTGKTRFVGRVDDMPSFWRDADVAVVPSSSWCESFGMTALEAMACGRPVVATANGGLAEVVADNCTGALVSPGDRVGLRRAIQRYATDPQLIAAHGAAGRNRAETRFDVRNTARQLAELTVGRTSAL